jgi:hypothetical protein
MMIARQEAVPRVGPRSDRRRFFRTQDALTAIVPIQCEPEEREALERLLEAVGDDVRHNRHLRFDALQLPHFLSWSFLPGTCDEVGRVGPPRLVFEANYCGPTEAFLEELYQVLGRPLWQHIYQRCGSRAWDGAQAFKDYFRDHAWKPALFYRSYPGLTARTIANDTAVHWFLHECLTREPLPEPPGELLDGRSEDARIDLLVTECQRRVEQAIQARKQQALPPLEFGADRVSKLERLKKRRVFRWLMVIPILPVAGVALALLAYEVLRTAVLDWRARLRQEPPAPAQPPPLDARAERLRERIQAREDRQEQNHLTLYVQLKMGLLRRLTLRLVLFGWNYLAKTWFTEGTLAGIEGIHFARWVLVDDGWKWWPPPNKDGRPRRLSFLRKRRGLLFLSNYDGSWEAYLDNFIDRASLGLTTIWCNTQGFPKTRLHWNATGRFPYVSISMGAQREEEFKHWVRQHQLPTTVWYSRHPDQSVSNIRRNRDIRSLSTAGLDPRRRRTWLQWL